VGGRRVCPRFQRGGCNTQQVAQRAGVDDGDGDDLTVLLEPVDRGDEPSPVQDLDDVDEVVELPFVYVPPSRAVVDALAAGAPLLSTIDALRSYLGEPGKPLSGYGDIEPADACALAELLDTGDDTATETFPGVVSVVAIAKHAGAVGIQQGRLVPAPTWSDRTATDRATAIYRAILDVGALGSRGNTYELFDTVDAVIDSGTVHWLAAVLEPGTDTDLDEIVEQVTPVLRDEIEPYWPQWSETFGPLARNGVTRLFETLHAAGVVEWTDPGEEAFRLTAFGRHVVADDIARAGYTLRRADDLLDAPAGALIDALDWVTGEDRQHLVDAWQPERDIADRITQISDAIAADSASRRGGFAALALFEPSLVGPAVRGLLNGPAAGHAAVFLLSRGLADDAEVGEFVDMTAFVDVLAATLDDPEELCTLFSGAPHADDQFAVLEQMWRHSADETQSVLDALGSHLPDRALAKAARTAAIKHRSWMANR